jgi:hypothetical protein
LPPSSAALIFCFKYAVPSLNIFLMLSGVFGRLLSGKSLVLGKYFLHYRVRGIQVLWPIETAFLSVDKDVEIFKPFAPNNIVVGAKIKNQEGNVVLAASVNRQV